MESELAVDGILPHNVQELVEPGVGAGVLNADSPSVDGTNKVCTGQNLPHNVQELVERLSETLGMAVATVFCEVFEQREGFSPVKSPVNELSNLLEAALKESLVPTLGSERTTFVENFKNSFIHTYMTIRSVRRAYSKTGGRLTPSRKSYVNSWRSQQKQGREIGSQSHRGMSRRNIGIDNLETKTSASFGDREATKCIASEVLQHAVGSLTQENIRSFINPGSVLEDEQSDVCNSSSKSCFNLSLQSSFFTSSDRERSGLSDTAASCSNSHFDERFESSLCSSSNHESGGDSHTAQSRSTTSFDRESLGSPPSQCTPDATDVQTEYLDTEDSHDVDMVAATGPTKSTEWVLLDRGPVSADKDAFMQDDNYGAPRFAATVDRPSRMGSDGSGSSWLGGGMHNSLLEHPADRLLQTQSPQVVPFGTNSESGETLFCVQEPNISFQDALRRGAGHFARTHDPQRGGTAGSSLIHRKSGEVREDGTQLTGSSLQETSLFGTHPFLDYCGTLESRHGLVERYLEAKETKNYLKSLEFAYSRKRLAIKEDHLRLQFESNILMREHVDLSRSKAEFKEFQWEDGKLTAMHQELSQMCADELVAGLCVMLVALVFSAWKFSYSRLSRIVSMCAEIRVREPHMTGWFGMNWVHNTFNTLTWNLRSLTCEVTKAGRILAGLIFIAFVASSLLRRSITSSSRAMPATILLVVLAGACGFAGKISIDSLGGDGFLWVLFWELLCLLHVFATCCTPWLYKYLYGPSSKFYQGRSSFWLKLCSLVIRIFFHIFIALILPAMAGLLPFASLAELNKAFGELWGPNQVSGTL